jgi:tetratricopeptide (TPR) repeat protein
MKKILLVFLALAPIMVQAQEWASIIQDHYEIMFLNPAYPAIVSSEESAEALLLAGELNQRFEVYNRLFRFDPARLTSPLKVRFIGGRTEFQDYVNSRVRQGSPSAEGSVYLHYNSVGNRELVVLRGEEQSSLPYQSFVQFLRAFIPNPPSWIREGLAVYFNTLRYNKETWSLEYEENLAWLPTVKKTGIPIQSVLLADKNGVPANFQALSWALVSFFLSGGEDNYRTLTDSIMLLQPEFSTEANANAVYERISLFNDMKAMQADFSAYLASRKTFAEISEAGQRAYVAKDFTGAQNYFYEALSQKPSHPVPHYYLGLVAYELKDYVKAEEWYNSALKAGAERGLVLYAMGVNAAAAGKKTEAVAFLREAALASPEKYGAKSEDLISKLR